MNHDTTATSRGVILFGHGARDPEWAGPMQRIRQRMLEQAGDQHVELAFLEFMRPTLDLAVDALVARGVVRMTIVPVFLAQGGHLKRDLPLLIEAAQQRHPACAFQLGTAVGEAPSVIDAIAEYALSALD